MEQEYKYMVCTVCATYNHAPYIVDAMNGFTMQETTFPVYYLITDDASTDGEPEVIKQYLAEHFQTPYRIEETDDYNLICAVHKTNPNCTFIVFLLKYNHYSIKKSKFIYQSEWRDNAKYIAICEGDDYWIDSFKIQKQVNYLEDNPPVSLIYTDINMYYVDEKRTVTSYFSHNNEIKNTHEDFILHAWFIAPCTWVYRNNIATRQPKLNADIYFKGDTLLYLTLSKFGVVHFMRDVTSTYRVLKISASHFISHSKRRLFWRRISNTRIFFAKDLSFNFRMRLWLEMVRYQRPSFRKHINRIPSWIYDSISMFFRCAFVNCYNVVY